MTTTGSLDLNDNLIEQTYHRIIQMSGSLNDPDTEQYDDKTEYLYDGRGRALTGIKMQEAFERDSNNDLQPTLGPFYDMFWEEDENGDKIPRDMKFWLDSDYNLIQLDAPS